MKPVLTPDGKKDHIQTALAQLRQESSAADEILKVMEAQQREAAGRSNQEPIEENGKRVMLEQKEDNFIAHHYGTEEWYWLNQKFQREERNIRDYFCSESGEAISRTKFWRFAFWMVLFFWAASFFFSYPKRTIELNEGTATSLVITDAHLYKSDKYAVEARQNPDEDGQIQWARKLPDGSYFFINAESLYQQ